MKSLGVDSLEIDRMERLLNKFGSHLAQKIFTAEEWAYCQGRGRPAASLAARFAAKEAVVKALGADWSRLCWREIVILSQSGRPYISLRGKTAVFAEELGITAWQLSLSHDRQRAIAVVIAE